MNHGETNLPETFKPKVPIAGCLKIGGLKPGQNGKMIPDKLDHIRFCASSAIKDGRYPDHPDFAEENAAKMNKFTVELISDNPAVNLEIKPTMMAYDTMVCTGNGDKALRRINQRGDIDPMQPFSEMPAGTCNENCPYAKSRKCKVASVLRFRIPGRTPLGYVWQFRSFGWNTAQELLGSMAAIQNLTGNTLARLPLDFIMTQQHRVIRGEKKTSTTFYTVGLAFNGSEEDLLDHLERIEKIKARYKALGRDQDPSETLIAEQVQTIGISGVMDEDDARSMALEYFPDSEAAPVRPGDANVEEMQTEIVIGEEIYLWSLDEKDQLNEALLELADIIAHGGEPYADATHKARQYWAQMEQGLSYKKVMDRVCNAFQRAKGKAHAHYINVQNVSDLAGTDGCGSIIRYAHKIGRSFVERPHFLKNIDPGFLAKALATLQDESKRDAFLKFCEEKANEPNP